MFHSNLSRYPGNTRFDLKPENTIELQNLYMAGKAKKNKNRRINIDKAYDIIISTVMKYDWHQKITLSVPNIKQFFSKIAV